MLVITLIIIGIFGFTYFQTSSKKLVPTFQNVKVNIGYMPFATNWAIYVADKGGFFKKEGLDINLIKFNVGTDGANALLRGDISAFSINTFTDILNIESRTPNSLKLYTLQQSSNKMHGEFLIARNGSNIKSISDLKGRKIGVTPGTFVTAMVKRAYTDKLDFTKEGTIVPLASNLQLQSLQSGQIDALLAFDPTATMAISQNIGYILDDHPWGKISEPFPIGGITFSTSFINSNKEVTVKIATAIKNAIIYGRNHRSSLAPIVSEYTDLESSIAEKISYNEDIYGEEIDSNVLKQTSELYNQLGVVDKVVNTQNLLYVPGK